MDDMIYDRDDETEIDIADMLKEIFKQWKLILLCAVVCMAAACVLAFVRNKTELSPAETAQIEEDIRSDYELMQEDYDNDVKLYEMRDKIYTEYTEALNVLNDEIDRLETIDPDDEYARIASLVKISSLQSAVSNADVMCQYYRDVKRPEKPADYDEYRDTAMAERTSGGNSTAKYGLIGLIAGGFMACCVLGLKYIFDGTVKTADEITHTLGINVLGSGDNVACIAANVRNGLTSDISSILVTGSQSADEMKPLAEAIAKTTGIAKVDTLGHLDSDADTILALAGYDAVVLAEKLKKTKLKSLREEAGIIDNAGKKLIGAAI